EIAGGGRPFPCQAHQCGCSSAEQCWTDCCCFSLEERLAWAARHGVEPPPGLRRLAAMQTQTSNRKRCCQSACDSPTKGSDEAPLLRSQPRVRWVSGIQARRCRGLATEWNVFGGAVAPPPPRVAWRPHDAPQGAVAEIAMIPPQVFLDRETPPG
ncbi:MAG: hypothetical protein KY475_14700, partial [Planctomycetes bacterium]|nr:hypothetical protein [Planctomycetota bacterium]